jgi:hypothetical protein
MMMDKFDWLLEPPFVEQQKELAGQRLRAEIDSLHNRGITHTALNLALREIMTERAKATS